MPLHDHTFEPQHEPASSWSTVSEVRFVNLLGSHSNVGASLPVGVLLKKYRDAMPLRSRWPSDSTRESVERAVEARLARLA